MFNQLKSPETSESITTVSSKSEIVQKVNREIKVYTEEDHLQRMPEKIVETYYELKSRILNLGEMLRLDQEKICRIYC